LHSEMSDHNKHTRLLLLTDLIIFLRIFGLLFSQMIPIYDRFYASILNFFSSQFG